MKRALFDPEHGYYSKNIRTIGARGDFTTAPQLSEAPAKAIAAWAIEAMRSHRTNNIIEIGPGLGTLSQQIRKHLPIIQRFRANFHLVDSSPTLSNKQSQSLGKHASIHQTIESALEACHGRAVIFSNELVDAFPVRLFELSDGYWQEVHVDLSKKFPIEHLAKPENLPNSSIFDLDFPQGQRVEVHESYHTWIKNWLPRWKNGKILTIDYGAEAKTLYERKPRGTLRAYLMHQCLSGKEVYLNQGLQDITADVNFTDLQHWTDPWLKTETILKMNEFLKAYNIPIEDQLLEATSYFRCISQIRRESDFS
ncbi:MAG: SAM-dependent methyltransferase [Akkermansiaceae bacterium]